MLLTRRGCTTLASALIKDTLCSCLAGEPSHGCPAHYMDTFKFGMRSCTHLLKNHHICPIGLPDVMIFLSDIAVLVCCLLSTAGTNWQTVLARFVTLSNGVLRVLSKRYSVCHWQQVKLQCPFRKFSCPFWFRGKALHAQRLCSDKPWLSKRDLLGE
jgi:hypothetical protein